MTDTKKTTEICRGRLMRVVFESDDSEDVRAKVSIKEADGNSVWSLPIRDAFDAVKAMLDKRHVALRGKVACMSEQKPIEVTELEILPGPMILKAKGHARLEHFPRVSVAEDGADGRALRSWATTEDGRKIAAGAYADNAEIEIFGPRGDPYADHTVRRVE